MTLKLYNTLTRTKEDFVPIDPGNVRVYVCGPTVYDLAHIGNARPLIVFDVLFRLLRHFYGEAHVTYVRNITDVDDKINARAAEDYPDLPLNEAIRKVTQKTEAQFRADVAALGCLEPTYQPRATEHVPGMVAMIEELLRTGHAYVAEGHVLFSVPSMPDYGRLSNRSLDEMKAGARVEVAPYKRDATDFVLWKPSTAGEPGWPSPWGIGRPGWHIECSAMAEKYLGDVFDIHGGGIDLVFPHHENEIAQSRCAHGTERMANIWMHNGFLQVEGEKMSKSLGNFVTIHQIVATKDFGGRSWDAPEIRLAMLRSHYRQPIDWTASALAESRHIINTWASACAKHWQAGGAPLPPPVAFLEALGDDLNVPGAIAVMHELARAARTGNGEAARQLAWAADLLGLQRDRWAREEDQMVQQIAGDEGLAVKVETLIAERIAARGRKDFKEADRIRAELEAMGLSLEDAKDPATGTLTTIWKVRR